MDINQIVEEVRPFLVEYLKGQNIIVNSAGGLKCINPSHKDKTASAQINTRTGGTYIYCNSCHSALDIFAAAAVLEDLPTNGINWIEDNVLELAHRFNIPVETGFQFHKDPKHTLALQAYETAAVIIANTKLSSYATEYIGAKLWSKELQQEFGLGSISCTDLSQALISSGYDSQFLSEIGLIDHKLFQTNHLIFPVQDEHGRCVGFIARTFDSVPKYINTSGIGPYSPYKKRALLFNLHRANKQSGPLYIMEGQADAITAYSKGIRAVALSGSSISEEQLELLGQACYPNIILCPDGDSAGHEALIEQIIPACLKHGLSPIPQVQLLADDNDPDDLITTGEWKDLKPINLAEVWFTLKQEKGSLDLLAEELVSLCTGYSSPIARNILAKAISTQSGISEMAICGRLEQIDRARATEIDEKRLGIINQAAKQLSQTPTTAQQTLLATLDRLEHVSYNQNNLGSAAFATYLRDIKGQEESRDDKFPGLLLERFPTIQKALTGEWRGKLFIIGGDENVGKSTLADAFSYDVASHSKNNAMVVSLLTDDSVRERLPKYICLADRTVGNRLLTYLEVTNPKFAYDAAKVQAIVQARDKAYQHLYSLVQDERIVLKDVKDGGDLEFATTLLKYYRSKYPDRHILLCVDSINRLRTPGVNDPRGTATQISNTLKDTAVKYDATVLAVSEFNRPQNRDSERIIWPNNKRLAESRALEFDANAIFLVYNDVHSRGTRAEILWRDKAGDIRPRVFTLVTKNKVGNWKGVIPYDFDEVRAGFKEISLEQAKKDWLSERIRLQGENEDMQEQDDDKDNTPKQAKQKITATIMESI